MLACRMASRSAVNVSYDGSPCLGGRMTIAIVICPLRLEQRLMDESLYS
jgi:hypothetical protein